MWLGLRVVTVVAVLAVSAGVAHAQTADDDEARALFEAGQTAYANGQLERALEHFQRSYELSRRDALLFNIATVQDRLRQSREAVVSFERYLAAVPDAPNAVFARNRLEALREEIASGSESSEPSDGAGSGGGVSVAGVALLVVGGAFVLGTAGTIPWWVDRSAAADECARISCVNPGPVQGERDAAMGLTLGLGIAGLGLVIAGAVLVATQSGSPAHAQVVCAPGVGGLACAGRF